MSLRRFQTGARLKTRHSEETAGDPPVEADSGDSEEEAGGPLVFGGGLADQFAEARAERPEALVAYRQADFGNREPVAREEALGPFHTESSEETVRCFAERPGELPVVVVGGETGFARRIGEQQRPVDACGEIITRPAKAAEEVAIDERSETVRRGENQRMHHDSIVYPRHPPFSVRMC